MSAVFFHRVHQFLFAEIFTYGEHKKTGRPESRQHTQAKDVAMSSVFGLVMATVTGAGVMEAIAAMILVTLVGMPLLRVVRSLGSSRQKSGN